MKRFHFSFSLLFIAYAVRANTPVIDDTQLIQVQKQIERIEYFISKKDDAGIYKSPNRENGLKATYTGNELNIRPQDAAQQWAFGLTVKKVDSYQPVVHPTVTMHGNVVQFDHGHHFQVKYVNSEDGIHQHFTIEQPSDQLTVQLQPSTGWKATYRSATGLVLTNNIQQLSYQDLKVLDANGKQLPAHFTVKNNQIEIAVDARNAASPLSIESVLGNMIIQQAKTLLQPNQVGAQMGASVSGAGDINGDGLADIIVAAPNFSDSESQEGAVFVYYGSSPNGINPNNYTKLEKKCCEWTFRATFSWWWRFQWRWLC